MISLTFFRVFAECQDFFGNWGLLEVVLYLSGWLEFASMGRVMVHHWNRQGVYDGDARLCTTGCFCAWPITDHVSLMVKINTHKSQLTGMTSGKKILHGMKSFCCIEIYIVAAWGTRGAGLVFLAISTMSCRFLLRLASDHLSVHFQWSGKVWRRIHNDWQTSRGEYNNISYALFSSRFTIDIFRRNRFRWCSPTIFQ